MNPTAFLGLILGPAFTGVIIFAPLFCYLYSFLGWNVDEGIELGFKLGIVLPYVFMFLVYAKGRAALETADEAKRRDHAQLMDDLYAAGGRNPIGQLKAIRAYSERRKQREAGIKHPAYSPAAEQKEEIEQDALMRTAEDVVASEEAAIEQLERYEGELKELAQEEIKMRRDAIRHAKEGDPEMARLLVGAANFQKTKREVLENRNRRIQAKQEQLSAQQAAQAEPKQVEADSIRALLGARIKEMEVILERLQAEREQLANVASAEELDALEMEIRARQKLIHAINQGADDMELHLCVERIRAWEEERKEFEQMRLSDA